MKKVLLATVLFVGVAFSSFAQKSDGGKFSIGVEAGLPIGSTSDFYSFVIGGSLKYEHPIDNTLSFTGSAGYSSLMGKTIAGFKVPSAGFIPVKAGIKYLFAESLYGEAQLGAVISTESGPGSKVAFAYAPGIGYNLSSNLDLGIRYEGWAYSGSTVSQIAARLAYSF